MTKPQRHPNVVNLSEIDARVQFKGSRFGFAAKRLGIPSQGKDLNCSWFEVEPGRSAFPHHYHCANEEAIFILEGYGELRIGADRLDVGPGDYIAFPVGPDHAHSLRNIGEHSLRYLCMSTGKPTDVVGYPDSKKVGIFGSDSYQGLQKSTWIKLVIDDQESVDYFEGEKID